MPSPNLTELAATTLRHRNGKAADNVSKNNVIYSELSKKGNVAPTSGGRTILEELDYAEGTFAWYSGYETINTSQTSVFSAAEFDWKQCASTVSFSGLEATQNKGKHATISLLTARIRNAERTMTNYLSNACYATGTGSGGREVGGLQLLIADTPTSGTVGGIDRATWTFWRNFSFDATTDGGAAATSANIQSYMNRVCLAITRGADRPKFAVADNNYYRLFLESLQAIQRVSESQEGEAGFRSVMYAGLPVYFDGGYQTGGSSGSGCPTNHMYFINPDFLKLRYDPDRNMTALDTRFSVNQDAEVRLIAWAGNMTCSNCALQGVLKD